MCGARNRARDGHRLGPEVLAQRGFHLRACPALSIVSVPAQASGLALLASGSYARPTEEGSAMRRSKHAAQDSAAADLTRREFLSTILTTSLLAGVAGPDLWAAGAENGIPYRKLGRAGERVSLVGLGGWPLGVQSEEQDSVRIIRTALDGGINFLDNCWDYNHGDSEVRMGKALRDGYRQKAFLMT